MGYLELGVVVYPPEGGRGHAGGAGAIHSLQGLLHQGNGLEVVFLPEAEQVGRVAQGSGPWGHTGGHRQRVKQDSCAHPNPVAWRGWYLL